MTDNNNIDSDPVDSLVLRVIRILESSDPELTYQEILFACMGLIGTVLSLIECPGCRQEAMGVVETELPRIIGSALAFAAERDGDVPVSNQQVH